MNSNILDHAESIFSEDKILDNSTRNENRILKEKNKIEFEDKNRLDNFEFGFFLQNPIISSQSNRKIFIEIPHHSSSKDKMNNTPTFSSEIKVNNINPIIFPSVNNSETFSDYLVNQTISLELINETPDLLLEELEGEQLNGKKLIINAAGLNNSPRKSKDGFVFFGTSIEDANKRIINDFKLIIDMKHKEVVKSEHIFVLFFSLEKRNYFIRAYHNHLMSYVLIKLDSKYQIHNNEYILIADIFFQMNIDNNQTLKIKKYANKKSPEEIEYNFPFDFGIITIGRDKNCAISFSLNKQFSKVHTSFHYDYSLRCWFVVDGGEKPSTIGTWIMPKHSYQINNGTLFKIPGNSKFKLSKLNK